MAQTRTPRESADTQETWKSGILGTVVLKRLDHRGELTRHEIILGGRTFHITAVERRLNQEMAANVNQDLFSNGTLVPVRLLSDSADAREIADNPNLMSESDMRSLLKGSVVAIKDRLAQVSNPAALERLRAMAQEEDVTIRKLEAIDTRYREVVPNAPQEVTAISSGGPGGGGSGGRTAPRADGRLSPPAAVTPR